MRPFPTSLGCTYNENQDILYNTLFRVVTMDCGWAKLSDFATLHLYNSELKYYLKYELVYTLHLFMG